MESIRALERDCRVARTYDKVFNSECCYTFHNPFTSEKGIVVNLSNWIGTHPSLALRHVPNDKVIAVRIRKHRVPKPESGEAPTKLGVGVDGGFASSKFDVVTDYSVVVLQKKSDTVQVEVELPYKDETKQSFPEMVRESVESVIHHAGLMLQQDVQQWQLEEDIPVSKYAADLPFVDNGVVIDPNPSTWKCEKSGDTENLWLNLSDGFIGGGRRNWDGTGGSNGALDHFNETGQKYPLVVKLGTITADPDAADCYSYAPDEDGPVKVPNLAELLDKRGIKTTNMQKIVKSTAELEVELNANYAFDAITEAGSELKPVSGPGLQGLQNLGNSCYINSVVQMLLSGTIPELSKRYGTTPGGDITAHPFLDVPPTKAPTDVLCQTAKVTCALTSGVFAKPAVEDSDDTDPKYRLAPRMLKHVIGKDHADFRTAQQQDAAQFLQFFLEKLDRAEMGSKISTNTSSLFQFKTTHRIVCSADGKVKYNDSAPETLWSLRLPMDKAVVKEGVKEDIKSDQIASHDQKRMKSNNETHLPTLDFSTCVSEWAAETIVNDIRWPHLQNSIHSAKASLSFSNFPRYLIVQAQRYTLGPDWSPIKLEVNLNIPQEINLTSYKSTGPLEGEDLVVEGNAPKTSVESAIDEIALAQLTEMGISLNGSKRALAAVGGSDLEAAIGYVFEHNQDEDFDDPLPYDTVNGGTSVPKVDEGVVQSLVETLGCFTADQVRAALQETKGAADRAADWLFSHMDDLDSAISSLRGNGSNDETAVNSSALEDGDGVYTMIGMISHIGKNTGSGHYITHLKKDGKWVIFNDEKVALSSQPPFEHAYLYLFQRVDTMGSTNTRY